MILVMSKDCLAARSYASCSARLICPRIHRKTNEDEGEDKECRRMSMGCTVGLGEWKSPWFGERRGNRKGEGIYVEKEGEKDERCRNRWQVV